MPTLNLTITNADIDLLAKSLNYRTTVPDGEGNLIPNPQTKGAFCKEFIIKLAKERIRNQKSQDAIEAANISEAEIT